jgi:hypothetical protein
MHHAVALATFGAAGFKTESIESEPTDIDAFRLAVELC